MKQKQTCGIKLVFVVKTVMKNLPLQIFAVEPTVLDIVLF